MLVAIVLAVFAPVVFGALWFTMRRDREPAAAQAVPAGV